MSKIYLTSDCHYSHKNIITYCNRPFSSVEDMNCALVRNINSVVYSSDTLYHLGDWAFGGIKQAESFRESINCQNVYNIIGNHDHYKDPEHQKRFDKLFIENIPYLELNVYSKKIVLFHYAMRVWDKSHRNSKNKIVSIHCYGHSHGSLPDINNQCSLDVGVDTKMFNHEPFTPYSIDEICDIVQKFKFSENNVDKLL